MIYLWILEIAAPYKVSMSESWIQLIDWETLLIEVKEIEFEG